MKFPARGLCPLDFHHRIGNGNGPAGVTVLLWLEFLLRGSYTGPLEPSYAETPAGQPHDISRQRLMFTEIAVTGIGNNGGPEGGKTLLLWRTFLWLRKYTGPPARPETLKRGVVGVGDCIASGLIWGG